MPCLSPSVLKTAVRNSTFVGSIGVARAPVERSSRCLWPPPAPIIAASGTSLRSVGCSGRARDSNRGLCVQ